MMSYMSCLCPGCSCSQKRATRTELGSPSRMSCKARRGWPAGIFLRERKTSSAVNGLGIAMLRTRLACGRIGMCDTAMDSAECVAVLGLDWKESFVRLGISRLLMGKGDVESTPKILERNQRSFQVDG